MFATTGTASAQIPDAVTLKKMKVTELKDLLISHGLPVSGKKDELVQRLVDKSETYVRNPFSPASASAPASNTLEGTVDSASASNISGTAVPCSASSEVVAKTASPNTATSSVGHDEVVVKPSGFVYRKLSFDDVNDGSTSSTSLTLPDSDVHAASKAATTVLPDDLEKRKQRAARFGVPLADKDKLAERAQRFGASIAQPSAVSANAQTPLTNSTTKSALNGDKNLSVLTTTPVKMGIDPEVLKRRQERFGLSPSSSQASHGSILAGTNQTDEEKKRKRAERFGISVGSEGISPDKKIKA